MSQPDLLTTIQQLQREVEAAGMRGIALISREQLNWFAHTRDQLAEMGAAFLAERLTRFIEPAESRQSEAAARLLELLTTLRVFDRTLTLESAERQLAQLAATSDTS